MTRFVFEKQRMLVPQGPPCYVDLQGWDGRGDLGALVLRGFTTGADCA
jgi:hypothetical protein